ncbi:MAG: CinA family nicotinamide mononucleotide deamidase-related protein [Planctomycetes bacterium]|nr:CinA family nicotinamide mononucleotide deamidase-related protein [Planctomycetota bacterium]
MDTAQTAELVAIGDELTLGRLTDSNSGEIARSLQDAGVRALRFQVVGDDLDEIVTALTSASRRAGFVLATGGLGPTGDDRTREAAALAAGVGLVFHETAWQQVCARFRARGREPSPSNRQQAYAPAGAEVLENHWGTAPGFTMLLGPARLFVLPGVPAEMREMLRHHVLPRVRLAIGDTSALAIRTFHVVGATEAEIGERITEFLAEGHRPRVGITAQNGKYTIRIVAEAGERALADAQAQRVADAIRGRLGAMVLYEGEDSMAQRVGRLLIEHEVSFALAESCTGGLLAAELSSVPGISQVFQEGFVTYSNAAKTARLGVDQDLLDRHGAVSVQVAEAMARGAAQRAGVRLALAITGIAGPGGGTPDKPVGTTCFGLCLDGRAEAWQQRFPDLGREFLRRRAIVEVLAAVLRKLPPGM